MKTQYEVIDITPDVAKSILETNTRNRTLSAKTVDIYASAMREGAWKFNGETIKISDEGKLIDGQHRLSAVILYGKAIPMAVLRGVPASAFDSLDLGKRRNGGDVLSTLGVQNSKTIAAALRFVVAYDSGDFFAKYYKGVRPTEIESYLELYPGIHRAAQDANRIREKMPASLLGTSTLCGLIYLCGRAAEQRGGDYTDATEFFESVATGRDLGQGNPAYTLRERLLKTALATATTRGEHSAVLCVRAWNAHVEGRPMWKLQMWDSNNKRSDFPVIK